MESEVEMQSTGDYLAVPETSNGAGVLVLHAWWGLTPVFKRVCDRLARAGYAALAPDLYAGKTAATIEEAKALLHQLDWESANQKIVGAAAALRSLSMVTKTEIGVLGFSLGGNLAQGLAAEPQSDVAATVIFYDALEGDYTQSPSAFQYHWAENDDYLDEGSDRYLLEHLPASGKEAEFLTYPGTGHWFFEADRPDAYNPQAAALAWERTLGFFDKNLASK